MGSPVAVNPAERHGHGGVVFVQVGEWAVPQPHAPVELTGRRPDSLQIPGPASMTLGYRPAGGGQSHT